MSATKTTQKFANKTTANGETAKGFSAEERAAMKERAKELKAEKNKAEAERDVDAGLTGPRLRPNSGALHRENQHSQGESGGNGDQVVASR